MRHNYTSICKSDAFSVISFRTAAIFTLRQITEGNDRRPRIDRIRSRCFQSGDVRANVSVSNKVPL